MAESTSATAEKRSTAKKATSTRTKKPTLDQSYDTLVDAFEDDQHPEHAEAVAYFEAAAARVTTEPAPTAPRNVVEAIVAVMREVTVVGKDGRNQKQNYDFRGIDGTVNALGPVMRKYGLIVTPHLKTFQYGEVTVGGNRTKQAHAQVEVEYVFRYSDADGKITTLAAYVPGESMDSGDKGTAKAMSVAFRICLLQTFAIPTMTRDPDEDSYERSSGPEPIAADALRNAVAKACEQEDLDAGFDTVISFYGDRLAATTITENGETLAGDVFVEQAKAAAEQARVEAVRREQDAAAEGKTTDTGPAAAPAEQPARDLEQALAEVAAAWDNVDALRKIMEWTGQAGLHGAEVQSDGKMCRLADVINERGQYLVRKAQESGAHEGARADEPPADEARAQEPEGKREQAARTKAREERVPPAERMRRNAEDELSFQSEVLGTNILEDAAPFLREAGKINSLLPNKVRPFLVERRGLVIEKLRGRGDATMAERYEAAGAKFPMVLSDVTDGADEKSAREQKSSAGD